MKKVVSLVLVAITIISIFTFTSSAASWPNFSRSVPIKVYTISTGNNTTAYSTKDLNSKKGTIYASDEIYIEKIGRNSNGKYYAYGSYPISSGRKYAYIPLSVITKSTAPTEKITAKISATTYRRASTSSKYGSIDKGDYVYKLATSGNYTQVLYNVGSKTNPSAWKMGWVKTSVYNEMSGVTTTTSNTVSSTKWNYPMKNTYVCGNNWKTYYSARPSRPYHVGIDIASRIGNSNVYAAFNGTVAATGYNGSNGNFVIIKHNVNGKIVYSFYAHLKSVSVSKGSNVSTSTKIGVMGNTGTGSAGAHLHFAVVDTLWSGGGYYGYVPYFNANKVTYSGVTYYNPHYLVQYNKLP